MKRTTQVLILAMVMSILGLSIMADAAIPAGDAVTGVPEMTRQDIEGIKVTVFSETFPEAYIETTLLDLQDADIHIASGEVVALSDDTEINNFVDTANANCALREEIINHLDSGEELIASVTATVFVEESVVNGKTESHLLKRGEVPVAMMGSSDLVDNDEKVYYNLTLRLNVFTGETGTNERYVLSGNAFWTDGVQPERVPATGDDYMGFTWGGGFDFKKEGCIIQTNWPDRDDLVIDARKTASTPNGGVVWGFREGFYHWNYGRVYAAQTTIGATLTKNNLNGGGNTTSVTLKYIHTYQDVEGTVSFSPSTILVTPPTFTLGKVDKQWDLVVDVSGLKY